MNQTQYERTYSTVIQMLSDRGYDVSIKSIKSYTLDEDNAIMCENKIIVVWIMTDEGISIKHIKKFMLHLKENDIENMIIVKNGKLTPNASKTIAELNITGIQDEKSVNKKCNIQVFDVLELYNNITKHTLVPKHELLSKTDSIQLLKNYSIKKNQMPRILLSDPQIKYFNWSRGDIIKITRKSGEITYRCVV
jgi:DNA-directed RNA polymerase I, II, and III subunit RPABC1